jgi:uncharacterized protein (TIGR03086 family)
VAAEPVNIHMIDLTAACQRTADVVANVTDDQLTAPTPCEKMRLKELVGHIGILAQAFAAAARKDFGPMTDTPPADDAPLDDNWRTAHPRQLADLARAWQLPAAWEGMTRAGGIDFPGEVGGLIALTEVVLHGWDVARAIGVPYDADAATTQACLEYLGQFDPAGTEGMFGPAVSLPEDAPAFDRVVALSGRDPGWGSGVG